MNKQDTGKKRVNTKDQFYTKLSVARECIQSIKDTIEKHKMYQWIEPSAGNGSFLIENCIALDIDPKHKNILKQDFLEYKPSIEKPILIYGNPPFGKQSSVAKKFIKHAATFASIIAFILPRSFVKPSMNKAFPKNFHCLFTKELEKDSFEVNEESYDVPCIFQIWQKSDKGETRLEEYSEEPVGFTYVKQSDSYDLSVRRVGINAGTTLVKGKKVSPQSHYFIKLEDVNKKDKIVIDMNAHTFPSNTVGPRSLSKGEINLVLNKIIS
jgi:hypothetical protein